MKKQKRTQTQRTCKPRNPFVNRKGGPFKGENFHHRALDLRRTKPVIFTAMSKATFYYRVAISKFVLEQSSIPINPFLNFDFGFFGLVSRDDVLVANYNLLCRSDEVWVFGPVSDGVAAEIIIARELNMPVRYFSVKPSGVIEEIGEDDVRYEEEIAAYQPELWGLGEEESNGRSPET